MSHIGQPIEFRLGASLLRRTSMLWALAIAFGLPLLLLLVAILVAVAGNVESQDIAEALASAWNSVDQDKSLGWQLRLLAILVPLAALALMMQRVSYLRITPAGIEAHIPKWLGLGLFGLSTGDWQVPWDSIRTVRLLAGKRRGKPALDVAGYRLIIETGRGQTRLSPFVWVLPDSPDHRLAFRELFRPRVFDAARVIERAPLVQALRARGIEFSQEEIASEKVPAGYDLAKHPGMVAQLALLFVAGIYALLDTFFLGSFMALEPLPTGPFVIATVAGAIIAWASGRGAPARERWVVGVLMVAALTAAVYPSLLRFNALTAEPQELTYRAVDEGQFKSTTPGFPDIDLRKLNIPEYWAEYPEGSEHEFDLIHGAAGFHQVDLRPVYARTREHYSQSVEGE